MFILKILNNNDLYEGKTDYLTNKYDQLVYLQKYVRIYLECRLILLVEIYGGKWHTTTSQSFIEYSSQ
jgi:hypothetical protein